MSSRREFRTRIVPSRPVLWSADILHRIAFHKQPPLLLGEEGFQYLEGLSGLFA